MAKDMTVILKGIYPMVDKALSNSTILNSYKKLVGEFIARRSESLYSPAPLDRIYYTMDDRDNLFKTLKIDIKDVANILRNTYYYPNPNFHPAYAKDELTIVALCIFRYFYIYKKDPKLIDMSLIYLTFSGKMYPSVHYGSFPIAPSENEHVMMYVVNHELNDQFDLKKHGTIVGALKSKGYNWAETYRDRLKDFEDDDVVYVIQQFRDRMKSFMTNIAEVFYDVYDNKDKFMSYDSDDIGDESYRLADNDSLKIERIVEGTMSNVTGKGVDLKLAKLSSSQYVKTQELSGIIETIVEDRNNIPIIKEFITILVSEYFTNNTDKDITNPRFISTSIASKPNTKNPAIIRQGEILETWLDVNSPSYRKRKNRLATKLAYHKVVLTYFTLLTHHTAKSMS